MREGKKEEKEAEEVAKELGVWDEFYGSGKATEKNKKGKSKGKKDDEGDGDESALQALMLRRNEKRKADSGSFLDSLASKYGAADEEEGKGKKGKGKGKKRSMDEDEDEDNERPVCKLSTRHFTLSYAHNNSNHRTISQPRQRKNHERRKPHSHLQK